MLKKLVLPAVLLVAATAAQAQQPARNAAPAAQQQLTPAQQQLERAVAQNAVQVAQSIDQNRIGEVWDGASEIGKKAASRATFVQTISNDRKSVGALKSRTLAAVVPMQSTGKGTTPAGTYINVVFATQFTNTKQPVRELISYHLDADNQWRLAGYTLR